MRVSFDPIQAADTDLIFSATSDGTVSNTTKRSAFPNGVAPIAPGALIAGSVLRVHAWGVYSTTGSPTLNIGLDLGTGIIEYSSSVTIPSAVVANIWRLDADVTIRTAGSNGEYRAASAYVLQSAGTFFLGRQSITGPNIDTTVQQFVVVRAKWNTASPSNTITMEGFNVQLIQPPQQ